jgi:hypothetical protein
MVPAATSADQPRLLSEAWQLFEMLKVAIYFQNTF